MLITRFSKACKILTLVSTFEHIYNLDSGNKIDEQRSGNKNIFFNILDPTSYE